MIDGRPSLCMTGDVRLENDGGFIQAALDLAPSGDTLDASGFSGVRIVVRGNGEKYSVHLRTPDNVRPWQSYRAHFTAGSDWKTIDLPFEAFVPYRLEAPLDKTRLRRIGLVAIGRAFYADLADVQRSSAMPSIGRVQSLVPRKRGAEQASLLSFFKGPSKR